MQNEMWAGIGQLDARNRAGFTQIGGPIPWWRHVSDQSAFFLVTTAKIIAIKIIAFFPGWSSHSITPNDPYKKLSP